jgi:hypothetical protein
MRKWAEISPDGLYRYELGRDWSGLAPLDRGYVNFIGLNPSTADAEEDDPTIRRMIGFTKLWGYDQMIVTNLFAFRATDPEDMKRAIDPIGFENSWRCLEIAENAALNVACWGTNGTFLDRDEFYKLLIPNLMCIQRTKSGHPNHPLYLPKNLHPILFARSQNNA